MGRFTSGWLWRRWCMGRPDGLQPLWGCLISARPARTRARDGWPLAQRIRWRGRWRGFAGNGLACPAAGVGSAWGAAATASTPFARSVLWLSCPRGRMLRIRLATRSNLILFCHEVPFKLSAMSIMSGCQYQIMDQDACGAAPPVPHAQSPAWIILPLPEYTLRPRSPPHVHRAPSALDRP